MTSLAAARAALYRADQCERIGPVRSQFLYEARDALQVAGFPRWADLAESAAQRIGGSDMRELLFDVDRECSRQEHAI